MSIPFRSKLSQYIYLYLWRFLIDTNTRMGGSIFTGIDGSFKPDFTLNLQTQVYYNVVRPDFGPEWQWRMQAQIMLPTNIFGKK